MYITPLTIMDMDMYLVNRYTNQLSISYDAQINNIRPPIYHTQTEEQTSMKSHTGQLDEFILRYMKCKRRMPLQ